MKYSPVQNFINGKFVDASTQKSLEVISPLDGNLLSKVPMSSAKDLDDLRGKNRRITVAVMHGCE